jgi:hypothetical protein
VRRPKYFPRMRYGTHSWIQAFHDTPATAPKQLVTRNQTESQIPAAPASPRGINGSITPSTAQLARCSTAAPTQITLGGRQRARSPAMKIWRKLPRKGSALISPMVVFGRS